MCYLRPCANPTEAGVWWRDDMKWCLYGASHQATIKRGIANKLQKIDLGTIVSSVHPTGASYVVNLQTMDQVAVRSGQRRPVMVIDAVSARTPQLQAPPQATFGVKTVLRSTARRSSRNLSLNLHYRDSQGNLQQYDQSIAQAIVEGFASDDQSAVLVPNGQSGPLFFNLESMEQHKVSHLVQGEPIFSNKPPVKVIAEVPWVDTAPIFSNKPPVQVIAEVPWVATAMAYLAAKADKCLRRKILVMVIDKFRSDEYLDAILPKKAYPWTIVSKSRRLTLSPVLHEKFIDSVEEILPTFPDDIVGEVMKIAESDEVGSGPLQIAFKPAVPVERSVEGSSKRRCVTRTVAGLTRAAFWTSMTMATSAASADSMLFSGNVHIRAYLVIIPTRTLKNVFGYILVDRPEHQLPLAALTLREDTYVW